ncbi:DMT family transporter [Skermanella rosea]|uniref:DMT family transporter n=1 Tax=Skermanella rosea TaxID=1817965 RepID=UPI001932531A|nr:DMT family transporter [Skermanella rosea]UEM01540.1 DMT family transporter [Skermanella rosea]
MTQAQAQTLADTAPVDAALARSRRLQGIGLAVAAVTLFCFLDTLAKLSSRHVPTVEVVWFRYAIHFVLAMVFLNPWRSRSAWRTNRPFAQIGRAALLTLCTGLNFMALRYLQLVETVTIQFLGPLFIAILSVLFLKETVGPKRWAAIAVGFAGILVVTRPGVAEVHWAVLLSLASAATSAGYVIMTRSLAQSESPGSMLLVMAAFPTVALLPWLYAVWVPPPDLATWAMLGGAGFFGAAGHFLLILAHRHVPASVLAPFTYAQIIGMVTLGYLVFGHVPSPWTFAGAAIIIASGLYLLAQERRA